jgi:hypothetical protein
VIFWILFTVGFLTAAFCAWNLVMAPPRATWRQILAWGFSGFGGLWLAKLALAVLVLRKWGLA